MWGQSLTINVGATVADSLIPAIVSLDFVGWRTGDPLIGSADRTSVYLHVYDSFSITAGGAVNTVGNLIAVSTNAVNLELVPTATDVSWFFGLPNIAKDIPYFYVMASDTTAASTGDPSNLVYSDLETGINNPHAGGQSFNQTGDLGSGPTSHDLFFRVVTMTPIPEPSTFSLCALGLVMTGISRRSKAKRTARRA